jgi:hypothetical protein
VDVKETGISFNRDKCQEVMAILVSSKQDDDAYRCDKIKVYTAEHTLCLQKYLLGTIYGVGARQAYPKMKDEIYDVGQVVLVRHGGTSV